jgi:hypothetical protein
MDDWTKEQILQLNKITKFEKTISSYDKMFENQLLDQLGNFKSCCDNTPLSCKPETFVDTILNNNNKALTKLVGTDTTLYIDVSNASGAFLTGPLKEINASYDAMGAKINLLDLNKNQLDDFQRSSKVLIGDEKENMNLHYFNLAYFTFSIFLMIFLFKKQFNYGGGYLFGIFILTIIMMVFLNIGFGIPCVGLGCL